MMSESSLDYYLRLHNTREDKLQKGITTDYSHLPQVKTFLSEPCYKFLFNPEDIESALSEKKILPDYYNFAVIKQDRFEQVPLHLHEWLELSYIYSGNCTIDIKHHTIQLEAGQIILINQNVPHRIHRCDENDIIINFLITKDYLNGTFFERLSQNNYLTHFFIETLNNQTQKDNYILFSSKRKNRLAAFANQFLCEFYSPSICSGPILDSFMTLLICELINVYQQSMDVNYSTESIYAILRYIEMNYANCTLESTASFFSMHPNYLSTYIKKKTGHTYKHLIQNQRLCQASKLLKTTNLSVNEISIAVGYNNTNFFFQKFKTKYGCTPKEYRNLKM